MFKFSEHGGIPSSSANSLPTFAPKRVSPWTFSSMKGIPIGNTWSPLRYADILQHQFNKRYSFPDGATSKPTSSDPFKAPYWRDSRLQSMKQRLNATKSKLNEMPLNKWHKHTKRLNPAGTVTQELKKRAHPELMTQAWQKFYECFQVLIRLHLST